MLLNALFQRYKLISLSLSLFSHSLSSTLDKLPIFMFFIVFCLTAHFSVANFASHAFLFLSLSDLSAILPREVIDLVVDYVLKIFRVLTALCVTTIYATGMW